MASIIRIKRSTVAGNPSTLAAGELAYSALTDNGSNGGDRLYIGMGTETNGNAANHYVVGGKFFTDRLDHTAGTLTANSALVVDTDSKIDILNVDNITLNGNTISTTDVNGNLTLSPNGTGLVSIAGSYTLPRIDGTTGYVLTTDGAGTVSWQAASSALELSSDSGTGSISLLTETLTIAGGEGIDTSISGNTVTIAAELATSTNAGVATFNTNGFVVTAGDVALNQNVVQGVTTDTGALTVTGNGISILGGEGVNVTHSGTTITVDAELASSTNLGVATFNTASFDVSVGGDVTIKTAGVSNTQLANSDVTIGTTTISLGGTSTTLAGLTELDVDNVNINGNTISATNTDGNVVLAPAGSGTVDVSSKRITSVAEPTQTTDAATKGYVDAVKTGLDVKESVRLATTENLTATYDNGTSGVGATLTNSGTQAALSIDGVAVSVGNRVLVKDQTTGLQNGIYVVTDAGSASTNWVLTRATDFDNSPDGEVSGGAFTFVEAGTSQADNGYVVTTNGAISVGVTSIDWVQFSGAGQVVAGAGLTKTGNTLDVQVGTGIAIVSDTVTLASSVAGDGLTFNAGTLDVVGTADRITVGSNSVDIASTYVGQTSITTLGTITTGTWNATTLGTTYGGTGLTGYSTGDLIYASATNTLTTLAASTEGKVLQINASGVPVWGDVDGGTY